MILLTPLPTSSSLPTTWALLKILKMFYDFRTANYQETVPAISRDLKCIFGTWSRKAVDNLNLELHDPVLTQSTWEPRKQSPADEAWLTCRSRTCSWIFSEKAAVLANMRTPEVRRSSRWSGWSSFRWCSLPRMKMTVLCRKRPQGWTGMEDGLSITTTSSFSASRRMGSAVTGGSCLCTVFRKKSLSCQTQVSSQPGTAAYRQWAPSVPYWHGGMVTGKSLK